MDKTFYISGAVAVISTLLAITRLNVVHSLLYMVTSLLAGSVLFFVIGAPYVAALQAIVYAGAIMVLFVFVIMMLNQGPQASQTEKLWLSPGAWVGPAILVVVLLFQMGGVLRNDVSWLPGNRVIEATDVSLALFGPYILVIELASMLLMAGLISAYHLGRREPDYRREEG
jgi:NADH-quinone oxidoreductase subunit J